MWSSGDYYWEELSQHQSLISPPPPPKKNRVSSGIYSFAKQTHTPEVKHGTWKLDPWKRGFLLETIIFRFHVKFRGDTHTKKNTKNNTHPMIGTFDKPRAKEPKNQQGRNFKPLQAFTTKKINKKLHSRGIFLSGYIYPSFLGYVGHSTPFRSTTTKKSTTNTSIAPSVFNSNRMALASGRWGWKDEFPWGLGLLAGAMFVSGSFWWLFFPWGVGWPWRCCLENNSNCLKSLGVFSLLKRSQILDYYFN